MDPKWVSFCMKVELHQEASVPTEQPRLDFSVEVKTQTCPNMVDN